MTLVQAGLLAAVVAVQLVCAVSLLVLRDPFDRLHMVGPVSVLATIALVVAAVIGSASSTHTAKVVVVGLLLWVTSPFSSRATARALRVRATGRLAVDADEVVQEPTP